MVVLFRLEDSPNLHFFRGLFSPFFRRRLHRIDIFSYAFGQCGRPRGFGSATGGACPVGWNQKYSTASGQCRRPRGSYLKHSTSSSEDSKILHAFSVWFPVRSRGRLHDRMIQISNATSAWSSFAISASLSVQSRAWQFSIARARCCVPKSAVVRNDF